MQPSKLSVPELFEGRGQYLIPLFQRGYVWTLADQVQPLWEDLIDRADALRDHRENAKRVGDAKTLKPVGKHFLGAIVVGASEGDESGVVGARGVIDGQQRITTLQIMLLALRDLLKPLKDEALDQDIDRLTKNAGAYKNKRDHMKVLPTNVGRDVMEQLFKAGSLEAVCASYPAYSINEERKKSPSPRPLMVQAYLFLYAMLACHLRGKRFDDPVGAAKNGDEEKTIANVAIKSIERDNDLVIPFAELEIDAARAHQLKDTLDNGFQIMRLQLDEDDDPQTIFETLNARGAPLAPSDLIRNFIFLNALRNGEKVDDLYDARWRAFDEKLDHKGAKFWKITERQGRLTNTRLDLMLYHYVALRKLEPLKVGHVFQEFKGCWDRTPAALDPQLERLTGAARNFETFVAPDHETRLGRFCRCMKLLDTSTATPLVLYLLEHHKPDSEELARALTDIESYLVRRFVCGLTAKGYNRIFLVQLLASMVEEKATDADTLRKKLLALRGESQLWPEDWEFKSAWLMRPLYKGSNPGKVRAILERLEHSLRSSKSERPTAPEDLSVEHIMPRKWKPEDYPLAPDTKDGRVARDALVHSIGNLTLVTSAFNSSLSNSAFHVKRPEIEQTSTLMLNKCFHGFGDTWGHEQIEARAESLYVRAAQLWPGP